MNKLAVSFMISAFAFSAHAQAPTPAAAGQEPSKAAEVTQISGEKDQQASSNCLQHTGTRIVSKDKNACVNAAGRSFSQADIRHTGATDAGDALQLLDPSIRVHHR